MKRFVKVIVVMSTASMVLLGPSAEAVTNVTTHLSLSASKTHVDKGDLVKFHATLKASAKKCRVNMPINLYKAGTLVATKKTNEQGKVVFKQHPKKTAKWWAKFPGKKVGPVGHPHRKNCLASQSQKIKVVVKS
jgi:hypothetical protein